MTFCVACGGEKEEQQIVPKLNDFDAIVAAFETSPKLFAYSLATEIK